MKNLWLKLAISTICLGLLLAHLVWPRIALNATALSLLVIALVPWLSDLIKTLELPSGFKLEFQALQGEVEQQKREIDHLTEFLFTHFVTEAEFNHLEALDTKKPYPFQRASYFDAELRRVRALGLVIGAVGY